MNRALLQQALDALEDLVPDPEIDFGPAYEYAKKQQKLAIKALRAELAKGEPEPVAIVHDAYDTNGLQWFCRNPPDAGTMLYTAPTGPEPEFRPDWTNYRQGRDDALAEFSQVPVAWMNRSDEILPTFHRTKEAASFWGDNPVPLYTKEQP